MKTRSTLRRVAAAALIAALPLLAACDPTPHATVYVLGDSNLPTADLHMLMGAREQPYIVASDGYAGLGIVSGAYGDGFAVNRTRMVADRIDPDVIVLELGINDRDLTGDYGPSVDAMMAGIPSSTKVIWMGPAENAGSMPGAAMVNRGLAAAQSRWPNLWAVSLERVLSEGLGGHCATLTGGLVPLDRCFVDIDSNVHLSPAGLQLWATLVRFLVDQAVDNGFTRPDAVPLIVEALGVQS